MTAFLHTALPTLSRRSSPQKCLTTSSATPAPSKTAVLRTLLSSPALLQMPCCYDALTARLVHRAGFPLTFMSGFSVAASRGHPDTNLLSYAEMRDTILSISETLPIPLIADGDTGGSSPPNVRRTVLGYAAAGASGILLEDQVAPKRCGHTKDKAVVSRAEAVTRVRAACDARAEADVGDGGPVVIARTDAGRDDFEEALERARLFLEAGADMTFVEAPRSVEEMERYAAEVPGLKLANMLEQGETPMLPPGELERIGFKIAAYPLTLLSAGIMAQERALDALKSGKPENVQALLKDFGDLKEIVGFEDYYELEDRYRED